MASEGREPGRCDECIWAYEDNWLMEEPRYWCMRARGMLGLMPPQYLKGPVPGECPMRPTEAKRPPQADFEYNERS